MNRRDLVKTLGACALAKWSLLEATAETICTPLKQLADQKGLLFGSCLAMKYFAQSPVYKELFLRQCDIATPELHMKWDSLSRKVGEYDFSSADQFVAFCAKAHMQTRGHTLVWHDSLPAGLKEQLTPANATDIMLAHISAVAGHFSGKLYSWDVVNEALDPGSGRSDGLRNSPWLQNIGVNYIEQAFRATAAADRNVFLIWNENYLELSNGFGAAKRKAMLSQLDNLMSRGVPIHGIGLEAHLRSDQADVLGDPSYETFLEELAKRKLKIFITELDIQDTTLPANLSARDKAIADLYTKFLTATLRQPAVKGVITWGLSDSFTWISGYRPRKDGLPVRPLPFDANFMPKPAYYAIAEAFEQAPHRY